MLDVQIENDGRLVIEALQKLQKRTSNLRPALLEIGDALVESTHKRFGTMTAPDGTKWELNSVLSTLLYKDHDRPLTGETGLLNDLIRRDVIGNDSVEIGSPQEYAAMQQFGGTKAEFPHLWGDIPARPFLGISSEDEDKILSIIQDYLAESTG